MQLADWAISFWVFIFLFLEYFLRSFQVIFQLNSLLYVFFLWESLLHHIISSHHSKHAVALHIFFVEEGSVSWVFSENASLSMPGMRRLPLSLR